MSESENVTNNEIVFSLKTLHESYPKVSRLQDQNGADWGNYLIESPFGNCQNFSINNFGDFIYRYRVTDRVPPLVNILRKLYKLMRRPFLVVDVLEESFNFLKENDVKFVITTRYTNATGARMRMCIIDLR